MEAVGVDGRSNHTNFQQKLFLAGLVQLATLIVRTFFLPHQEDRSLPFLALGFHF